MSRRVVFLIALLSLALLGLASAPWTLTGSGLSTAVSAHMKERYGIDVQVKGRSTIALLPIPRVKFEDVTLRLPDQGLVAEDATVRGELRILPLLVGRVELAEVALHDARINASLQALRATDWAQVLKGRPDEAYARRLIVATSSLRWTDMESANLDQIDIVIRWTGQNEPLYVAGSARWRDELVSVEQASVYPDLLAANQLSPFSLTLAAASGRITVTGETQLGDDPRMTGEGLIQANSVRDFSRWSGVALPLGSLLEAVSVKGDFSINKRRLSWPSVAVTLGSDKLEGTVAVRFDTERPLITGTLAADKLNLSDLFLPLTQLRTPAGSWSDEAVSLVHTTGSNLDLRLSASTAQVGRLRFDDLAASVLVRPGRIEASIGRADFHSGTVKGRLSLTSINEAVEFKSQGAFSGVDIAGFLGSIGHPRWITGSVQGQFAMEGWGQSPAEMVRRAHGRSSVTVKEGELVGLALADALRRVEKRPLLASLNWKGGRTPFEQTQAQIVMKDGVGVVQETRLTAPALLTNLQGQVSLIDRTLSLKADVSPASQTANAAPVIVFDVSGGWDSVIVAPDARALIERSGAAKPLLGPDRVAPVEPRPQATAQ